MGIYSLSIFIIFVELTCTISSTNYYTRNWKEQYSSDHYAIVTGKSAPKYLISIPVPYGLADRILGSITQLLIAILSRRAFMIADMDAIPSFDSIFETKRLKIHIRLNQSLLKPVRRHYNFNMSGNNIRKFDSDIDATQYDFVYMVDSEQDHSNSVLKDIQVNYLTIFPSFNPNVEKVLFACNIGYLHEIFHNPYHHHQLLEMGFISPIHMFNELFHFLFEIRPSICHGVCLDIKNRLMHAKSNSIPIVGIQIRVGDKVFFSNDQGTPLHDIASFIVSHQEVYRSFMQCALDISDSLRTNNTVIFLVSDSIHLRQHLKEKYESLAHIEFIADISSKPVHWIYNRNTRKGGGGGTTPNGHVVNGTSRSNRHFPLMVSSAHTDVLAGAAADMYLLSLVDYYVLTAESGYGKVGALITSSSFLNHDYDTNPMSLEGGPSGLHVTTTKEKYTKEGMLKVYMVSKMQRENRHCNSNTPDDVSKLYEWSGV